jgi:hypothetical protein
VDEEYDERNVEHDEYEGELRYKLNTTHIG